MLYKYIVSNIDLQFYLQKNIPTMFRKCITKIRLSSHNLFIETGRYTGIARNERKCILCSLNVLKDEFHFVLQCTKYNDLRKKYIKKNYWSRPSTFKLVRLLSVENRKELCNLGKFIHLACKSRNNLVWLTCVFIIIVHTFLTYLCYFLIGHIYTLYAVQSCYYNIYIYILFIYNYPFTTGAPTTRVEVVARLYYIK